MGEGQKDDAGKLRYSLLPPLALAEVVAVLEHGALKYGAGNWRHVPNARQRYWDAAQRHLWAAREGEVLDKDSGLHHLAHAACCVLFALDLSEVVQSRASEKNPEREPWHSPDDSL